MLRTSLPGKYRDAITISSPAFNFSKNNGIVVRDCDKSTSIAIIISPFAFAKPALYADPIPLFPTLLRSETCGYFDFKEFTIADVPSGLLSSTIITSNGCFKELKKGQIDPRKSGTFSLSLYVGVTTEIMTFLSM